MSLSKDVRAAIRCPYCHGALTLHETEAVCQRDDHTFPVTDTGQYDFRLDTPKRYECQFEVGASLTHRDFPIEPLAPDPTSERTLDAVEGLPRTPQALFSYLPEPRETSGDLLLDLGCGEAIHRQPLQAAGYEWVGIDIASDRATVRGDGQALPFADDTFDAIVSTKVLAHVQNPFVFVREARRVLRPGGRFVGSVAFAEPFNGNSVFHCSPLGVLSVLRHAGFEPERIAPGWNAVTAQAVMALFPLLPARLSKALVWPVVALHRLWYALGSRLVSDEKATERFRRLKTAGEFYFVASKPAEATQATQP